MIKPMGYVVLYEALSMAYFAETKDEAKRVSELMFQTLSALPNGRKLAEDQANKLRGSILTRRLFTCR